MSINITDKVTSSGLIVGQDSVDVSSGGKVVDTTVTGEAHHYTGFLTISIGGTAESTTVAPCGRLDVYPGGTATNIKENGGCVAVQNGAIVTFASNTFSGTVPFMGAATVHSGTTSYKTTISSNGSMLVYSGGIASSASIASRGSMFVSSGGTAVDVMINYSGFMDVSSGGTATNVVVSECGSLCVKYGATMQDITVSKGLLTVSAGASVTNVKLVGGELVVENGGKVENITSKSGTVYADEGAIITYKGKTSSATLQPSPDCDNGWNDDLYVKKTNSLNTNVYNAAAKKVSSGANILLDKSGISHDGKSNYVGYGDVTDFTKISLNCGARLVFDLKATDATRFTIWTLTASGMDKQGNTKYKMKAIQTVTLKKDGLSFAADTKPLLLEKGDYYISMESTNARKGGSAYYNVTVDDSSVFYSQANDFDDRWAAFREDDYYGLGHLGTVNGKKETLYENWVGFGDAVDYRKFTLKTAAKLNFAIIATDATKFSICQMVNKKENVYTLKTLQSTSLKKYGKNDYFAVTKSILLEAGDYYLRVESTNEKKGGSSDYTVNLDTGTSVFYDQINTKDDWDDMKKEGAAGKVVKYGVIDNHTTSILSDWVGYHDHVDFRQFTINTDAKLRFDLYASDATKFTIWKLSGKTNKKGVTTYSLKKVQATTIHAHEWRVSKEIKLASGVYYFSMESTNAKKGGNASYDIGIYEFSELPKSGKNASSLTVSDSGTSPDPGLSGTDMPETGTGFVDLAGTDLANMAPTGIDADAICASPIPVIPSSDIFDGLAEGTSLA